MVPCPALPGSFSGHLEAGRSSISALLEQGTKELPPNPQPLGPSDLQKQNDWHPERQSHPRCFVQAPEPDRLTSAAAETSLKQVGHTMGIRKQEWRLYFSKSGSLKEYFSRQKIMERHQDSCRSACGPCSANRNPAFLAQLLIFQQAWSFWGFLHPSVKSWWTQFTAMKTRLLCITKAIDLLYNTVYLI